MERGGEEKEKELVTQRANTRGREKGRKSITS